MSSKDDLQAAIPVGSLTALQQVPVKDWENGNCLFRRSDLSRVCFLREEFIKTSLGSKRQLRPTPGHRLRQESPGRNPKALFHFLLSPQAALARLCCGLQAFQVALDTVKVSHGPSLEPATVSLLSSCFLDLFLVTCCFPPQTEKESESCHSAMRSRLPCKNVLKHNLMHSLVKHGHPDVTSDVDRVALSKQPAISPTPRSTFIHLNQSMIAQIL